MIIGETCLNYAFCGIKCSDYYLILRTSGFVHLSMNKFIHFLKENIEE